MKTQVIHTTCTMDCPDSCSLEVQVKDGKIEKISGAGNHHPDTAGFICTKISRFARRVYHPHRLLHPMRRAGGKGEGKFERITWEEAISEIAGRFHGIIDRWGAEAIMPFHYGGSNALIGDEFLDDYFFARLGASRCVKTFCAAPSTAVATGMYGKMPGVAFSDYPAAKCIIIWGANPKASNIHLVPYLKAARSNGAFVIVVDPRNNFSGREVDLHLPVYPGADLPLALGMIHHLTAANHIDVQFLEQHSSGWPVLEAAAQQWPVEKAARAAGVNAADIVQMAERYAGARPAVIRVGWGVERNRNGGQAIAAILALPAICGKFAVRGGGYTLSNSGAAKLQKHDILGEFQWQGRALNQSLLGPLLLDEHLAPPIKALFVYNANPAATAPDQNRVIRGLCREDLFTVVFEQVMTDTALYADILLPAVTFLEQQEIKRAYGSYVIGGVQPAIAPCGEAHPNEAVFAHLGRAMGFADAPFNWDTETCFQKVAGALSLNGGKADPATLAAGLPQAISFQGETPVQFQTALPPTADGKVHLAPAELGPHPFHYDPVVDRQFPLALISPANNKMISSTLGEFNYPQLRVTVHPADAEARGIASGQKVRVFNSRGEVHCIAEVSEALRPGVVSMPKGAWRKSSLNGQTATALCPATTNEVAGGACFNDARVQIEKI